MSNEPELTEIAENMTTRLIPAVYHKPPVLEALSGSGQARATLERLEALTNTRLNFQKRGSIGLDRREAAFGSYGASHINAAFAYTRTGGNRFNDDSRGAWYAAFDEQTALEEVAYHRTRELSYINFYNDEAIYVAMHASMIGHFHDIRDQNPPHPSLDPDVEIGYPRGQALALGLRKNHQSPGLLYNSVRDPDGYCIVIFLPQAVQDVRPGAKWKIVWDGSPHWQASPID